MDANRPSAVKSALRTLDVIEFIVARPEGAQAGEIAAALSIPVSSASYLLRTLCERDYLLRRDRLYLPGPGLDRLRLPAAALGLPDRVRPLVRAVRAELNETTSFMVRAGWCAQALVTEASDHPLRYAIAVGDQRPLHVLAAGKAILAELGPDDLASYFAGARRDRPTAHTLSAEPALRAELERIRERGFAEAREESVAGICSIGCAIRLDGQPVGALSIAVPTVRFTEDLRGRFLALQARLLPGALNRAAGAPGG